MAWSCVEKNEIKEKEKGRERSMEVKKKGWLWYPNGKMKEKKRIEKMTPLYCGSSGCCFTDQTYSISCKILGGYYISHREYRKKTKNNDTLCDYVLYAHLRFYLIIKI